MAYIPKGASITFTGGDEGDSTIGNSTLLSFTIDVNGETSTFPGLGENSNITLPATKNWGGTFEIAMSTVIGMDLDLTVGVSALITISTSTEAGYPMYSGTAVITAASFAGDTAEKAAVTYTYVGSDALVEGAVEA